jgi:D-methionine transport system permease protein
MSHAMLELLFDSTLETLVMVASSSAIAALLGAPLGVVLLVSARGGLLESAPLHRTLGALVNAARSTPFIILLVAVLPLTRLLVGSSIGTAAAVVPLTLAAVPFVARLTEASLREVDHGLIEAAQAMGATPRQIIAKVLLPESLPGLVAAMTITVVNLISYSAMAGAVGGGGLGDLGIRYGYQRFQPEVMAAVVAVLIAMVQGVQWAGDRLARRLDKRRKPEAAA